MALPWEDSGSFDPAEWQWVWDGPLGGVYKSTKRDMYFYVGEETRTPPSPPKAASGGSSGGGGSTNPTNIYVTNNPGQLYQTITSDGSDGFPAGTVYQKNQVTGDFNILYKPPAAKADPASLYNDVNGDGYDDQTGRIVGSYLLNGNLYYQGTRINPDGSPYTGSSGTGKPDAPTWTGYGPKGQGTYYLDGPNGTAGTYIGPTAAGASSGTAYATSGSKGSGGGGGAYEQAQQDTSNEAKINLQKQLNAENLKYQASLMALKQQYDTSGTVSAADAAALEMQRQSLEQRKYEFEKQYGLSAQELQRNRIKDFESAVSDTDQAKLTARRLALGNGTGDVGIADLLRNTEGGFQANDAAAALLAEIRGQGGAAPVGSTAAAFGVGALAPVGAVPAVDRTNQPSMAPVETPAPVTPQRPTIDGRWGLGNDPGNGTPIWFNYTTGEHRPFVAGETTGPTDWALMEGAQTYQDRKYQTWAKQPDGTWMNMTTGQVTTDIQGVRIDDSLVRNGSTGGNFSYADPLANGHQIAGGTGGLNSYVGNTGGQDALGQKWGTSAQTLDPNLPSYVAPGSIPYGNDDLSRPLEVTPKVVLPGVAGGGDGGTAGGAPGGVPGYARGGMAPVGQPAIVGERGPEMMIPTPQGTIVRPMHPVQAQSMLNRGTPGYAYGTSSLVPNTYTRPTTGVVGSRTTTMAPVTQPTQSPAPVQPTSQPLTQPMQPVAPVSSTQPTAQTQPVAPTPPAAPAMQPVAPQTAGGSTVPTGQTYDPLNPAAVTPATTAYLDEIQRFRDSQNNLSGVNFQDVSFNRLAPTYQQAAWQQYQTRTGIPIGDLQYEQKRYALAGAGRAMRPLGL